MKLDHYLTPYTKINSKWTKDMNIRPETIKPQVENIGSNLLDIGLGGDFFEADTKSKIQKSKNKQVGLYQIKSCCTAKKTINKMKRQPTEWEKILQIIYLIH